MANIVFTPSNPSISAAGGTLELQVAYMGIDSTWDIEEVTTPSDIYEVDREIISSSGEGIVYRYTFQVDSNVGAARTFELEFSAWNSTQTLSVTNTVEISQAAGTTLSAQVSPSTLSFDVLPGNRPVTCSIYNTGSTLSVTPVSTPNWITVAATGSDENIPGVNGVRKFYRVSVARNSGEARNASIGFQVTSAGQTVTPTFEVSQSGFTVPAQVTVETPSSSVSSDVNSVSTAVTYSVSGISEWTIEAPSSSLSGVTFISNSINTVSSNLRRWSYTASIPVNQGASQRNITLTFKMTSGSAEAVGTMLVSQAGRAQTATPTVNWAANLFEFESEGASVGTVAYVSGAAESNILVTGDHTPTVNSHTTNNVVTASIQFNVPANSLPTTRSTYMTVSAWNSAGTASSVLEIRTAGTDEPTPVLPSGSIVVTNSPYTASANENSYTFTVRYVNCVSGEYTIDGAGGGTGMDNPVSQSTTVDGNDKVVTYLATFPTNLTAEPIIRRAFFQMHRGEGTSAEYVYGQGLIYQEGTYAPGGAGVIIQNTPVSVAANVTQSTFFVTYSNALQDPWVIHYPSFSLGAYLIDSTSRDSGQDTIRTYTVGYPANQTTNPVTHSAFFKMSYGQYHDEDTAYVYQAAASPSPSTYSISCSWDYYDAGALQQIARTIKVTYYGGQYPDDFVGVLGTTTMQVHFSR